MPNRFNLLKTLKFLVILSSFSHTCYIFKNISSNLSQNDYSGLNLRQLRRNHAQQLPAWVK